MGRKLVSLVISLIFLTQSFLPAGYAQESSAKLLNASRSLVLNPAFNFPVLKFLNINSANPNNYFNFLLDSGTNLRGLKSFPTSEVRLTAESRKLINYFFLGLTLPASSLWVNLQPNQEDKITSDELAKTDLGKVLLEQDLWLKKDMANYLNPRNPIGKEYWKKLYSQVSVPPFAKGGQGGINKLNIQTNNRVWITPDEAEVTEIDDGALVTKATFRVMLESEYFGSRESKDSPSTEKISEQLIREIIIPAITKDVNTSPRYAPLRQIYYSLILAQWYKRKNGSRGSGLGSRENQNINSESRIPSLESRVSWSKDALYQQYLKSYTQGEYKEAVALKLSASAAGGSAYGGKRYPLYAKKRMYFSGGMDFTGSSPLGDGFKINVVGENTEQDGVFNNQIPVIASSAVGGKSQFPEEIKPVIISALSSDGEEVRAKEQERATKAEEILKSIEKSGLIKNGKSGLSMGSGSLNIDDQIHTDVHGVLINLRLMEELARLPKNIFSVKEWLKYLKIKESNADYKAQRIKVMINGSEDSLRSVLGVVLERQNEELEETYNQSEEILKKRLFNAVVMVRFFDKVVNTKIGEEALLDGINEVAASKYEHNRMEGDIGLKGPVPMSAINAILVPSGLKDIAEKVFPKNKIIIINETEKVGLSKLARLKLDAPAFADAIIKLVENNKDKEAFWVHGVRLPTEEDVKNWEAATSSSEEREEIVSSPLNEFLKGKPQVVEGIEATFSKVWQEEESIRKFVEKFSADYEKQALAPDAVRELQQELKDSVGFGENDFLSDSYVLAKMMFALGLVNNKKSETEREAMATFMLLILSGIKYSLIIDQKVFKGKNEGAGREKEEKLSRAFRGLMAIAKYEKDYDRTKSDLLKDTIISEVIYFLRNLDENKNKEEDWGMFENSFFKIGKIITDNMNFNRALDVKPVFEVLPEYASYFSEEIQNDFFKFFENQNNIERKIKVPQVLTPAGFLQMPYDVSKVKEFTLEGRNFVAKRIEPLKVDFALGEISKAESIASILAVANDKRFAVQKFIGVAQSRGNIYLLSLKENAISLHDLAFSARTKEIERAYADLKSILKNEHFDLEERNVLVVLDKNGNFEKMIVIDFEQNPSSPVGDDRGRGIKLIEALGAEIKKINDMEEGEVKETAEEGIDSFIGGAISDLLDFGNDNNRRELIGHIVLGNPEWDSFKQHIQEFQALYGEDIKKLTDLVREAGKELRLNKVIIGLSQGDKMLVAKVFGNLEKLIKPVSSSPVKGTGGIDLSNIEVNLKDEQFVSSLNPADLKILRAAKALKLGRDSLAVLYIHELMLMLKYNLVADFNYQKVILQLLGRLNKLGVLDPEALRLFGILQVNKNIGVDKARLALYS